MLVNEMLYNSEVRHSKSEKVFRMLETVDEYLPRALVDGQLGILVSGIWCPTHPVYNLL